MTDTHGLSRKEHILAKLESGQRLTDEERVWAVELLRPDQLIAYAQQVGSQRTNAEVLPLHAAASVLLAAHKHQPRSVTLEEIQATIAEFTDDDHLHVARITAMLQGDA